jgi:hypothetical protein
VRKKDSRKEEEIQEGGLGPENPPLGRILSTSFCDAHDYSFYNSKRPHWI